MWLAWLPGASQGLLGLLDFLGLHGASKSQACWRSPEDAWCLSGPPGYFLDTCVCTFSILFWYSDLRRHTVAMFLGYFLDTFWILV